MFVVVVIFALAGFIFFGPGGLGTVLGIALAWVLIAAVGGGGKKRGHSEWTSSSDPGDWAE